jgi:hypothetical protein
MNLFEHGNELGDTNLAYKPEIVNDSIANKTWDERHDVLFQKEKKLHRSYLRPTLAQKDSLLRFPENGPRYKSSEGRNHIAKEVRAVGRVDMEKDRTFPIFQRNRDIKAPQNFRNQLVEKQNYNDISMTRNKKAKNNLKKKIDHREEYDGNQYQDDTNILEFYNIFQKTSKRKTNRLPQDMEPVQDETGIGRRDWKKPTRTSHYINPGSVSDSASYIDMIEKVNHIESKLKIKQNRPNLNFKTIAPIVFGEQISGFARKFVQPKRSESHMPTSEFKEYEDGDKIADPNKKDHYTKKKSNMVFKIHEPSDDPTQYSKKFKKQIKPNLVFFRTFGDQVLDDADRVNAKYVLSKNEGKKGNLSFSQIGHNTQDTAEINQAKYKKITKPNSILVAGVDERPDEDKIAYISNKPKPANTKMRVNRNIPTNTVSVSADPYNETKRSALHPAEMKKKREENKRKAEFGRPKNQEYL